MRSEFTESIKSNQAIFGLKIPDAKIEMLADYCELVQEHNNLVHLVAPCSPTVFATRHILESLTLLEFLPENASFVDVGSGAGLPSIPCLIVRSDLSATLIESKIRKSAFLNEAVGNLSLSKSAKVVNRQFEETEAEGTSIVTCRALDRFAEKLPKLIRWSGNRRLVLFGGSNLKATLVKHRKNVQEKLMPLSERRYLYIA